LYSINIVANEPASKTTEDKEREDVRDQQQQQPLPGAPPGHHQKDDDVEPPVPEPELLFQDEGETRNGAEEGRML
jgi:hypothetical protein